jgi:hypothetical protein
MSTRPRDLAIELEGAEDWMIDSCHREPPEYRRDHQYLRAPESLHDRYAPAVEPVADLTLADWLQPLLGPPYPSAAAGYESSVRIHHTIEEDLSVVDRAQTWDQAEAESPKTGNAKVDKMLAASTLARGFPDNDFPARRVLWEDLAARYDVPFRPGIVEEDFARVFPGRSWPRYLVGPEEGSLQRHELSELCRCLAETASGVPVFAFYWFLATADAGNGDLIYRGSLTGLPALPDRPEVRDGTPTVIWPEDRSWVVHTDWDSCHTVVAGSRGCIDALRMSETLETVEV